MLRKKEEESSILSTLWNLALGALKNLGFLENLVEKSLKKYKGDLQGWAVKTVVLGLSIFTSLAFLILGLFFMAIDFGGIPRGVVFVCGGLLGLLVLRLMLPAEKFKTGGRVR
jgi:hypothetical protein